MEFHNTKKIAVKGGYFQIATSEHEQYGKSIAISILGKKQHEGKWLPDYDNRMTVLCSFNQASKIAAYLRLASFAIGIDSDIGIKQSLKIGKNKVVIRDLDNKTEFIIQNENEESKSIEFIFETANIVADLITIRLIDLDVQDESEDSEETPKEDTKEYEHIHELIEKTGFFTPDGIQGVIEAERKKNPNVDYLVVIKELADRLGVEY